MCGLWRLWGLSLVVWMVMGEASVGQTISTVAGGGLVELGDDGPATRANLNSPRDVFGDGTGNLYIADSGNNRIRKVDQRGTITTVAGGGTRGFFGDAPRVVLGDGHPATLAFVNPVSVFVDDAGGLYLSDSSFWGNGVGLIRKVEVGFITRVAGGEQTPDIRDGDLATRAGLRTSNDMFVDGAGNIYIADTNNHRIRKVDEKGIITTIVGIGIADFSGDGGPATQAGLRTPRDVFLDGSGNLYIADTNNHRIRKVDRRGMITTVAGNGTNGFSGDGGPATGASLNFPRGVIVDGSGNLYIADTLNHRIRKVDEKGMITTVAGTGDRFGPLGDGGPATDASLSEPNSVYVDGLGDLYIADTGNHLIRKIAAPPVVSQVSPEIIRASDFNGDGKVAFADFLDFVQHFGKKPGDAGYESKFDLDGDQEIGFNDFLIFVQSFGQSVDNAG
ncbi:MAG: hypothetical protein O7G87_08600 [bacterium]|nr:hypothetical protein [bacterium]